MKKYLLILLFFLTHITIFSNTVFFKISSVQIQGAEKTKESLILNETGLKKDRLINKENIDSAVADAENKLWNTGNFSKVSINYLLNDDEVSINITVEEKKTLIPYLIPFYSSDSGLKIIGGIIETNFLGLNKTLIATVSAGTENEQFFLKYIDKSVFSTGSLFETEFEYSREKEYYDTENYDDLELLRYEGEFLYPLVKNLFSGIYFEDRYSLNNIYDPNPSVIISPSLLYSSLININYFKKGHEFRLRHGIMSSTGGYEFYLFSEETAYFTFSDKNCPDCSYFAFRGSLIHSPGRELFFNSSDNLRGISDGEIRGKSGYAVNFEYRHFLAKLKTPFPFFLYVPFYADSGNLAGSYDEIDFSDARYTCGSGIVFLPEKISILIRLDLGMNISSYNENKENSLFFSAAVGREMF